MTWPLLGLLADKEADLSSPTLTAVASRWVGRSPVEAHFDTSVGRLDVANQRSNALPTRINYSINDVQSVVSRLNHEGRKSGSIHAKRSFSTEP